MKVSSYPKILAGLICVMFCGAADAAPARQHPNVLLILTDDQGYGDVRSHGNDKIDTPILDKLAEQGARFDRFYVSPVCAPTRASLLTGRYHLRTGVSWVTRGLETMRSEEVTLAELFKKAGYATGCFGKWHNGAHYPYDPNGQGFDEFFGFSAGHWNVYFNHPLRRNGRYVGTKGYISDVLTDAALKFIEQNRDRPFFCYVPYNAPHSPFQVPDRYFDKYKNRGFGDRTAAVYGMVENLDENIGRLLKKLDELTLAKDTIVVFLTDNGPNGQRYNDGMKGTKGSVHEGGVRVPLFVRWPGHIEAGTTVQPITAHIDLLPTITELCGVSANGTRPLDGKSLVPLLKGMPDDWPDRMIFTHQSRGGRVELSPGSLRTQQHRLVYYGRQWELYDMQADPGQKKNIAALHPEVVKKLRRAYEQWFADVTSAGFDRLPIPVGYAEAPKVMLPAHECYMEGKVRYAGKGGHGWAHDWVTNWMSTDDRVWWDIDVVKDGRFEVTLLYDCPAKDVGSTFRIEAAGKELKGMTRKSRDIEIVPVSDRAPHAGVPERVWASTIPGVLEIEKGRHTLTVRALSKAGQMVFDVKGVLLRRVE